MSPDDEPTLTYALTERTTSAYLPPIVIDLVQALKDVAHGELAKGSGLSAPAWRTLHDVCAEALGAEPAPKAQAVIGRQPMMMPRKPPHTVARVPPVLPTVVSAGSETQASVIPGPSDIRERDDVAAELARLRAQGAAAPEPREK